MNKEAITCRTLLNASARGLGGAGDCAHLGGIASNTPVIESLQGAGTARVDRPDIELLAAEPKDWDTHKANQVMTRLGEGIAGVDRANAPIARGVLKALGSEGIGGSTTLVTPEKAGAFRADDLDDFPTYDWALAREKGAVLFELVRDRTSRAVSMFVSHRFNEVSDLSDRVVVMKDVEVGDVVTAAETKVDALRHKNVGRDGYKECGHGQKHCDPSRTLVRFASVSVPGDHDDIAFDPQAGKVLCLTGTQKNGREVILLDHPTRGLDIGVMEDVYDVVRGICDADTGILLVADVPEDAIGPSLPKMALRGGAFQKRFDGSRGHRPRVFEPVHHMI